MYDWTVLNQTVSETIAGGRVGAPSWFEQRSELDGRLP